MICLTEVPPIKEDDHVVGSSLQLIGMERGAKVRYPLALKVRYRTLGQKLHSGVGQTVNMSSGGALVVSRHELFLGAELEVRMEWPSLLDGWIPLQLVALGRVVRCGASSFAVCFRQHQFRTLRSKVQRIASSVCDPLEDTAKKAVSV